MKRFSLLLLLPLASGALFAQTTITPATLPNGTFGVSYSANMTLSPGTYVAAWSISAGSLPPGLNLSPATGTSATATISGTPIGAGTYTFTVQANLGTNPNAAPILVTHAYTIVIAAAQAPPVSISPSSLPNGAVGTAYSQVLTASGGYGAGTYTFSIDPSSPGSLPPGLTITTTGPTTGAIWGTPVQAGIFIFGVRVTSQTANGASVYGTQGYAITLTGPPPAIATTSLPAGTVGVPYSQALAATGGAPPYTWQLTGGSLPGGLLLNSPGTLYGTPTAAGSFTFQVTVSDSQQGTASGSFTVVIAPAALVITTTSLPAGTVGTSYTATTLAAAGGTPPYTWSVASGALPSGLSVSSAGVISGTPTAAGTFSVTLQVNDSVRGIATKAYSVTVAATAALSIFNQTPLPGGEVGVGYTQAFVATGGTQPYQWSVSAGTVPPGLTLVSGFTFPALTGTGANLNSTAGLADYGTRLKAMFNNVAAGVRIYVSTANVVNLNAGSLAGTPTAAGTFNFTVQVADSAKATVTKAFTMTVIAAVKIITAPPMPDGVTGAPYTQQFLASGGLTPYVWSIAGGSIPSGLSLSTATGLLSGTPTTPGTYTVTIGVTDQNKQTDSASYTIRIVAPLSITTQTPLPGGVVGVAYTQTFAATGGTSPYQWSVSTGTVPTGLTPNSTAGSLTGTPTAAGTFNFTMQVVDAAGRSATAPFTITVTAALTITTASPLPNGTVGTAYSQTLTVAGGTGPFTWGISTGSSTGTTPPGIPLNSSTGSLAGTPTAPGTFTFTVGVTGGGQSASKVFTITVVPPPGPPVIITVSPTTPAPATQPALGISIGNAYPLDFTGQITLTFASDSPSTDDPEVVFLTGGRTVSFTVPANTTQVVFSGATPGVQIGTVSGTITLTLKLTTTATGIDITPSPAPSSTLRIAKSAPVIASAAVTRTSGGFNLVVVGYATSREMVSANVGFTAAAGVTLASNQATISLSSVFTTWYQSSASAAYGSQFSLTMPFTFTNGTNPLTSVSVQLTNAQGSSTTANATY
jgi:hypothetical protein